MNCNKHLTVLFASLIAVSLGAAESETLYGWNVSVGGNFGFGIKTDLQALPVNAMRYMSPIPTVSAPSREEAGKAQTPVPGGSRVVYDAARNYYIDPDSSWGEAAGHESETWNWRLPDSSVVGTGAGRHFVLSSGEWSELSSVSDRAFPVQGSDDAVAYGASIELSHALWMSEDAKWGVDVAFSLAWMRAKDCFRSGGLAATRSASVESGDFMTTVPGDFFAYPFAIPETDGTWGNGTRDGDDFSRARDVLDLNDITTVPRTLSSQSFSESLYLNSRGDYEEWEIAALLRPWYDVSDWFCVHGSLGLGVTRSSFDYTMEAICNGSPVYRSSEEFSEWRCYGIAGAGMLFRVWRFDLSCDGLFRWCQNDMEINGRDVRGSIQKPWAVLRLGVSYAF